MKDVMYGGEPRSGNLSVLMIAFTSLNTYCTSTSKPKTPVPTEVFTATNKLSTQEQQQPVPEEKVVADSQGLKILQTA